VAALVERNRQDAGLDGATATPRRVRRVGIVGAGLMGTTIAAAHVRCGLPVVIVDNDRQAVSVASSKIAAALAGESRLSLCESSAAFAERKATSALPDVDRLVGATDNLAALAACDLVIEAIVETFAAKHKLFGDLEGGLPSKATLTSNTSTIPIGRLAVGLAEPARFCGFHFCHPVLERPLVEVVRGPKTSDETVATAVAHAKTIGKMPIVVQDGPGFLVNRLLLPYLSEAMELLLEGAQAETIEQAATDFGWAKGPLHLLDEIGLDTTLQGGWILSEAFPERIPASPLLVGMIKAGRLGCKAGAGFFSYRDDRDAPDDVVRQLIAQWAHSPQQHTPHSITARLLLPMLLEATRLLEENKVRDPRDIDLGVLFGLGFPAAQGGVLWWADGLGAARIIEMLRPLQRLGQRAHPTALLRTMARRAGHFYSG
jgi:3-hydroxyacyl-CoA dehydrogenase/enoyl-CoA hydratase/3-hydroxybutyryl-CoA epimerase/3-hydroxyacyl-CoA dehydrogenase/enoyl-CoA hydratase/3-hydroxybutyryl-CoA epimerase/enoyl-CoA isomerase